ncbi:hypothetical protein [Myroides marinus]|uniref:hypothetical protein n=1 Tax=Myroides marinus TaxID=703342 RepID=UPI002575A400|nr:hypothetical protein [Myroides marinus]MDM1346508.1 hypothetical protein [Myroides marinus]MDM1349927.1 hypothetical protein [Myroides marinus]MDM1357134.1 hypothetical protein [Myroides marinus]
MSRVSKVIVTVVIIFVWILITGLLTAANGGNGRLGIIGFILAFGVIAAIRSVWKKEKNNHDDNDHQQLDKTI